MGLTSVNGSAEGTALPIIDIRNGTLELSLADDIRRLLNPGAGREKKLPTLLLYNAKGLKLFEDITYLDQYYLTDAEIDVLIRHADELAAGVKEGSMLVELGSGNLRKVKILLDAFERAGKSISYYALDLSLPELERTLQAVYGIYRYVKCYGLLGTYDEGLDWLKRPERAEKPKAILWIGSSIGNFDRPGAVAFLKNFSAILRPGSADKMIIGIDACQDPDKVYHAYNDRHGVTHEFIRNGLANANEILGANVFDRGVWKVIGEYDTEAGRHHAFVSPLKDVKVQGVLVRAGERVRIEESYKYSLSQSDDLWVNAGLLPQARYGNGTNQYNLHVVTKHPFCFSLSAEEYAKHPVPTLDDWVELWAAWDTVSQQMIPHEEMLSKPIKLRNACIFYIGHIPAFLDIYLTRATKQPATDPAHYHQIFERGVDPDVDNPENCHAHSAIPAEWPPLEEILAYGQRVRARLMNMYEDKALMADGNVSRALWISFEHEAMHLETLLYMLLQSEKCLPPTGIRPDFEAKRPTSEPNDWVTIPETEITIGTDDPEHDEYSQRYFGWDNEKPQRKEVVPSFEAKAQPLTNEDYALYLERSGKASIPASWLRQQSTHNGTNGTTNGHTNGYTNGHTNGHTPLQAALSAAFLSDKYVRTVYGPVPLSHALDWPVCASYDELAACAEYMGGRIPTASEVGSIYEFAERNKLAKKADSILTRKIAAVNGHLSNEGVEISPPSANGIVNGGALTSQNGHVNGTSTKTKDLPSQRAQLFTDLHGANVGFQRFHPTAPTGTEICGRGELGGVWEWTSTVLSAHKEFEPMDLYPAYTQDFFDGKHNVVLGGSWATHPRIAGRKSFVNWYQRNYPYAWCGARLVHTIHSNGN